MYQCLIREDIVCANAQSWFSALKECLHLALLVTAVAKLRGTKLLHRRHPASRLSNDADIVDGNVHSHHGIAVVRQTARQHDPFARSLPEGVNRAVHTIIMFLEEHITYTGDGVSNKLGGGKVAGSHRLPVTAADSRSTLPSIVGGRQRTPTASTIGRRHDPVVPTPVDGCQRHSPRLPTTDGERCH